MLPYTWLRVYHKKRHQCHRILPPQGCATGGRVFQRGRRNSRGELPRGIYHGVHCNRWSELYVSALTPAPQILGAGRGNVAHVPHREGVEALDELHSRDIQPPVPECLCPAPLEKIIPFHGSGVPLWSRPTVSYQLPGMTPKSTSTPPATADPGGLVVCCPESGDS